jgi:hypothetical protein
MKVIIQSETRAMVIKESPYKVIIVSASGAPGAPGAPGTNGTDGTEDPGDITLLFDNALI